MFIRGVTPRLSGDHGSSGLPGGVLPVRRAGKTFKGRRPGGILIRCPDHLNWLLSTQRKSGKGQPWRSPTPSENPESFLTTPETSARDVGEAFLESSDSASSTEVQEFLKELFPPLVHIPSMFSWLNRA